MKFRFIGSILILLLLQCGHMTAQSSKVVQGSVLSKSDNEPLIGAYLLVKDETGRVLYTSITDFNGQFVVQYKSPTNVLEITFLGFIKQEIPIGNNSEVNILLEEDTHEIDEVKIIAERKVDNGGFAIPEREIGTAVQTFSMKDMEGVQSTSIDEALQGRIAGLDIVSNSGDLGSGSSMRIRGTSSINGNSNPLIVVNGIIYDTEVDDAFDFSNSTDEQYATMLSINPDDIEEISVLKDAASTAIWGSRGASGVIMIKTKTGIKSPTKIQYSYRFTATKQPQGINMLNGDDYTMMMKQAYFNPDQDEDIANIREFMYDDTWSEYENFNNNVNWVDEVSQIGFKHDHYIGISGGGDRARYRVSGGFLKQTGTVIGQSMTRFSSRSNLDYSVSDRIKFISDFSFTYTENNMNYVTGNNKVKIQGNEYSGILQMAYTKMPNVSVYDQNPNSDGGYYNIPLESTGTDYTQLDASQKYLFNPVALGNLAKNTTKNYRIIPTFRLRYDILDPAVQTLRYELTVSFDINNTKHDRFLPSSAIPFDWYNTDSNYSEYSDSQSMKTTLDNKVTWQPNLSHTDHSLMVQGAFWMYTGNSYGQSSRTGGLPSIYLQDASVEGYTISTKTGRSTYRALATTFQAHYSYKKRYVFGASYRRDGSTKLGTDNKFGDFPGVYAKWIVSDEPFMLSTSKWLSMLALRPSWGKGGKEPGDDYLYFSRYFTCGRYMDMTATAITMQLSNLKWETSESYNLGVDLGLFDEKIRFDFNYYYKKTEGLLMKDTKLPSSSGYSGVKWSNIGTMDNKGWELYCYTNNLVKSGDFRFDVNFNLANNKNTIIELRQDIMDGYNSDFSYSNGSYMTRIQENNPFGSIYGFRSKGTYQYSEYNAENGHTNAPVAKDRDGNVIVDEYGDPLPMYYNYAENGGVSKYEFQGGDSKYEDINHDGSIDELDIVYLGNCNPKLTGGFGTSMYYKNFTFRTFFNFRYGNDIVNIARMNMENMYTNNNQSYAVNWRWRKDGDDTEIPRALYGSGYNWLGSDRFVEDGSFLRFKQITLGYSVPKKKLEKYNIERLSFTCTINNIYVWTKYTGVDPEVGYSDIGLSKDRAQTPRPKQCTLGLSVTF